MTDTNDVNTNASKETPAPTPAPPPEIDLTQYIPIKSLGERLDRNTQTTTRRIVAEFGDYESVDAVRGELDSLRHSQEQLKKERDDALNKIAEYDTKAKNAERTKVLTSKLEKSGIQSDSLEKALKLASVDGIDLLNIVGDEKGEDGNFTIDEDTLTKTLDTMRSEYGFLFSGSKDNAPKGSSSNRGGQPKDRLHDEKELERKFNRKFGSM